MINYLGDDKFLSFVLKPKLNEKISLSDVLKITKNTFEKYRLKELETFFICGQEIAKDQYVWYWELMPEVFMWKQKYGKSLHTTFKKYVEQKFDRNKGNIIIFIAHTKHPNYLVLRYDINDYDYFINYIDLMRTMRFEMNFGTGKSIPVGKDITLSKIGIIDNYRKIKFYYNINKYNVEVVGF